MKLRQLQTILVSVQMEFDAFLGSLIWHKMNIDTDENLNIALSDR